MKKKYLIFGGILIAVILTAAFVLTSSKEIDKDSLSEIEKYALFRAELTCKLSNYGASNMWQAMEEIELLAYEYGYVVEEIEPLETKYSENDEFWFLMMNRMKEMCPEVVELMGLPDN